MKKEERDGAGVAIREMRPVDYDALLALWREAGLPYRPRGRDRRLELARQLEAGPVVYLVAEVEGTIVGAILGTHDGRKGWINRLAVSPAYRRRGIGARLVAEVERRLAARGIEIFACLIEEGNEVSLAAFQRLGYKPFPGITYLTKRLQPDV